MKAEKKYQATICHIIMQKRNENAVKFKDERVVNIMQDKLKQVVQQSRFINKETRQMRTRILPEDLTINIPKHSRSRTVEETKIDLFGKGSALNSLLTSPIRTMGNSIKGIFSTFPARANFKNDPNVQGAINTAWGLATGDYCERFGWIVWNSTTGVYNVPNIDIGDQYGVTPSPKPANPAPGVPNPTFHVGEFHIHPPLDPGIPGMTNSLNWPIGPSKADEEAAQGDNSPGIVRDFNTISRLNGTTDYTYGPWKRI